MWFLSEYKFVSEALLEFQGIQSFEMATYINTIIAFTLKCCFSIIKISGYHFEVFPAVKMLIDLSDIHAATGLLGEQENKIAVCRCSCWNRIMTYNYGRISLLQCAINNDSCLAKCGDVIFNCKFVSVKLFFFSRKLDFQFLLVMRVNPR